MRVGLGICRGSGGDGRLGYAVLRHVNLLQTRGAAHRR
jgi:hypothetical protein